MPSAATTPADVSPDASVDMSIPGVSATVPAIPNVPTASTSTAPPAAATDDPASLLAGSGSEDDAADDARSQYARDNAAFLKHFKSQGGQTQVDPTGQEVPQYGQDGGLAYKPTTLNPVVQRPMATSTGWTATPMATRWIST